MTGVSGVGSPINIGSTSILEFPLNVASDDIVIGNHGHYIMFYINEQEKARLSIGQELVVVLQRMPLNHVWICTKI